MTAVSRRVLPRTAAAIGVWSVAGLVMLPFLWFVLLSFMEGQDILAGPSRFLAAPTLRNYADLMSPQFLGSFTNSAVVAIASTVLSMLIGVPGAYALARVDARKARLVSIFILASRMLPPVAFAIPYFLVYRYAGLLDTRTGLVLIYMTFNLSLVVWLMRSFFENVPRELEEAAAIDGASRFKIFLIIVLPASGPAVATAAILSFLYAWNDFFFALTLTRSAASTAPVQIVNFMNYEGWEWGRIAAGGVLVMAPVLLISLLMRKYLVSGMTAGAVKS